MLFLPRTEEDDLKMWHLRSQIQRKINVYIRNCIEGQKILKAKETICRTIMYYIFK